MCGIPWAVRRITAESADAGARVARRLADADGRQAAAAASNPATSNIARPLPFTPGTVFRPYRGCAGGTPRKVARRASPDLVLPGDHPRPHAGRGRAVPGLEPRPRRRDPPPVRLEHPPERQVLPRVPRGNPPRHRDRPVLLLFPRLDADLRRPRTLAA